MAEKGKNFDDDDDSTPPTGLESDLANSLDGSDALPTASEHFGSDGEAISQKALDDEIGPIISLQRI